MSLTLPINKGEVCRGMGHGVRSREGDVIGGNF